MEEANKKECPRCGNLDVFRVSEFGYANLRKTQGKIEMKYPVYRCRECGKRFIIKESK
jgi:DNA-directed RNA polymerase subunit RPC12/RpoP